MVSRDALPRFLSLNGPDNVGKTTHLARIAEHYPALQPLGSIHHHDPTPWNGAAQGDYATWWFEKVSTRELTGMMLASHAMRAAARSPQSVGLLDRGLPMLLAAAAATSAIKDSLTSAQALAGIEALAAESGLAAEPEAAILLLPSRDAARSYAITSVREGRVWTGVYVRYQHTLHEVLTLQASKGTYAAVIDCEGRSINDVHVRLLTHAARIIPALFLRTGDDS
ncbi:hypothetical protein E6W39_06235 [Kitasatospora acidiphila]|uniref:Thymidylate kinase n=1 Tax=Kitasatospora acidiphila TaxID=2567942 RepID=A0A540VYY3_9ACTN|nr:hypothetical protein [Kitasatospora acidiphila]TQF01941.1 hypothetical protein E6W39_06235 [Kitasatospora acidiphila]